MSLSYLKRMKKRILSVFVDESGKFQYPDACSRFYIVGMVLHDQNRDVSELFGKLDADWRKMGLVNFCFHAGPLVRGEKGYRYMLREQRAAIFARMMIFARQMAFSYHCLLVDKKYVTSVVQIVEQLRIQLGEFLDSGAINPDAFDTLKIYYDCGQAPITKLLHDTFAEKLGEKVEFAQDVRPGSYKLFQLADLICTIKLTESKLAYGEPLTVDERRIFRGPRIFKHDILRGIKRKEI